MEKEEIEFDSVSNRWDLENNLKKRIRSTLLSEVAQDPTLPDEEIEERIEQLVDEHIGEFLDD